MKKIVRWIVVCLLAMSLLLSGCGAADTSGPAAQEAEVQESGTAETAETEAVPAETDAEPAEETEAEEPPVQVLDYEAMYASIDPDEVVMTVNGREITWNEYYYWLSYYAEYIQYYMDMYSYYGMTYRWSDAADAEGTYTLADSVILDAENHVGMICVIEDFAEENGITLSPEEEQELEDALKTDIADFCGEDATEEDFDKALREEHLTLDLYRKFNRASVLYRANYKWLYGLNGEKVSDEDALRFLEENGYMHASHILFMTVDSSTREELDEETVAEKKARAEKTAAELQAIEDREELLNRFSELKAEYCEDTGKYQYPDGYVFLSGTMVEEFENACLALEDYQVSDPVLSAYGYHILLRLPPDPDAVIEYSSEGTALNARAEYANTAYTDMMQERYDEAEIVRSESIENFSLLDYLTEAE
jgi:hypothetical protein